MILGSVFIYIILKNPSKIKTPNWYYFFMSYSLKVPPLQYYIYDTYVNILRWNMFSFLKKVYVLQYTIPTNVIICGTRLYVYL